jgi:hypothetical protein
MIQIDGTTKLLVREDRKREEGSRRDGRMETAYARDHHLHAV